MGVMIVGGAGFIGSHLVDRLLADGATVDVVDDLSAGSLANLAEARAVGGSLKIHHLGAASNEVASLIGMRKPEVLYHLAAVPRGGETAERFIGALAATVALLEAAREHRVPKVVATIPAAAVYGRPAARDLPLKEQPLEPRGIRGVFARATVDLMANAREHDDIEYTALALASAYGPRQRPDGGVVAALHAAAAERRAPVISGDGRQTRDLVFVDDVVDALERAGSRGSGLVVNIGTGEQTSIRDLWTALAGSHAPEPEFCPARVDELARFAVSPVRARIHLSWSPWTRLADGVGQLR